MLGQLVLASKGWGKLAAGRLYGLPVLRAEANCSGVWGEWRLHRAGRALRRSGVRRVLAPRELLPALEDFGLKKIDSEPFIRAQSVPLVLTALERRGVAPDRATVALRGMKVDRDMARTAVQLCPMVRSLVIDAPRGGRELAQWLRREFGVPVLPEGERGQMALAFQEGCPRLEEEALRLYGARPELKGLRFSVPSLEEGDREELSLLTVLWEGGRLGPGDIKIT